MTLEVKDTSDNSTVVSEGGTFSSKLLQYTGSNYCGFEVLFASAVKLKRYTSYQIEALISGARSWKGDGGMCTIESSGVTFAFSCGQFLGNSTGQSSGQFPEFLFN